MSQQHHTATDVDTAASTVAAAHSLINCNSSAFNLPLSWLQRQQLLSAVYTSLKCTTTSVTAAECCWSCSFAASDGIASAAAAAAAPQQTLFTCYTGEITQAGFGCLSIPMQTLLTRV